MPLDLFLVVRFVEVFFVKDEPYFEARVRCGSSYACCILTSTPCTVKVVPVIVIENTPELVF